MAWIDVAGRHLWKQRREEKIIHVADQRNFVLCAVAKQTIQPESRLQPGKARADHNDALHPDVPCMFG
jgi:hypothetical protein